MSDGNGGSDRRIVVNVAAWRTWAAIILTLASIGVIAQQAFTAGVRHEIQSFCSEETTPPNGSLYRTMDGMANTHVKKIETNMDKRFDTVEGDIREIQTEIRNAKEQRTQQHEEIMDILKRFAN